MDSCGAAMNLVFVLQFSHLLPGGEESIMLVGVYRTAEGARAAAARLSAQPGFCEHPQIIDPHRDDGEGFYVDEYALDQDNWASGFVTVVGEAEHNE
jgi:hypothetical protein